MVSNREHGDNDIFSGPQKSPWRRSADTHDAYLCKYVTTRGALKLPKYQYRSSNASLLYHYVIQHYLAVMLPWIPIWMAPNLVTLIGLAFTAVAHGTTIYYCPRLAGVAPSWVYLLNAFCFWAYQTLDHLDGKQARRTGSSSPLGLLFDHGCDAINTTTVVLNLATCWQLGPNMMTFSLWAAFCGAFFLGTLEEYYTGYLNLPTVNAPNEGLALICGFFLITAFVGPEFWVSGFSVFGYRPNQVLWAATLFCSVMTCLTALRTTLEAVSRNKDFSLIVASTRSVPFVLMVSVFAVWIWYSPSQIFARHPRLILWTLGLMFAKLVTQLMIAHICDEEYHPLGKSVTVVIFAIGHAAFYSWAHHHPQFLRSFPVADEEFVCKEIFSFALFVYLHMIFSAINEVKNILKVNCFSIPPPPMGLIHQ